MCRRPLEPATHSPLPRPIRQLWKLLAPAGRAVARKPFKRLPFRPFTPAANFFLDFFRKSA
jgi:hypothetical protein